MPSTRLEDEQLRDLYSAPGLRIERIVSTGQATPEGAWFDQAQDEWVVLLKGSAGLLIENEAEARVLASGDWVLLRAHQRHRVAWTAADEPTVWLAVHAALAPNQGDDPTL